MSYCYLFSSVNISHFKLLLRNHWVNCNQTLVEWSLGDPLPKLCPVIPTSYQDGHEAKNRKKWDEILKNLFWNYWANLNQILLKWSLGGPLPFDRDGPHSAVALLLKAALIQVSDYRLLGASGSRIYSVILNAVIP